MFELLQLIVERIVVFARILGRADAITDTDHCGFPHALCATELTLALPWAYLAAPPPGARIASVELWPR